MKGKNKDMFTCAYLQNVTCQEVCPACYPRDMNFCVIPLSSKFTYTSNDKHILTHLYMLCNSDATTTLLVSKIFENVVYRQWWFKSSYPIWALAVDIIFASPQYDIIDSVTMNIRNNDIHPPTHFLRMNTFVRNQFPDRKVRFNDVYTVNNYLKTLKNRANSVRVTVFLFIRRITGSKDISYKIASIAYDDYMNAYPTKFNQYWENVLDE